MSLHFFRLVRHPVVLGFFTLLGALSVSWLADGINGDCLWKPLFEECDGACSSLSRTIVAFFLVMLAMVVLWIAARDILTPRHLRPSAKFRPHKVIIAAVSSLGQPVNVKANGKLVIPWDDGKHEFELTGDLEQDIENVTAEHAKGAWRGPHPWNGQQFFRAIAPHIRELKQVILLGSPGVKGSHRNLSDYERLVSLYAPAPNTKVDIKQPPVEFEEIDAMEAAFDRCIHTTMQKSYTENYIKKFYTEDDIVIDVTGGQKTASIAAVLATLSRRNLEFQYVRTGGDNRVLPFNVIAESSLKNWMNP